ncbi:beta-glucosidase [Actinoplanes cyaneus]|uniref:beta-glucosidase n=1 Tax=Actinoplanes cyaneus TaxID=52696 RepID=A0A919MBN0_9ACTN|nr:glycoside hydrolase family 3 N-terminal domain-containing protein [Actinoplanes cyaneus]MCW2143957.1 beta-glucosidase [Actinoplanes cyaneus]GID69784.1 beta-glucosidase [Actinoplanes cyaneus]
MPRIVRTVAGTLAAVLLTGLAASPSAADVLPYLDPSLPVADRVTDLLGRMTPDDKTGQLVQGERATAGPADVTSLRLGSVLSGGGSAPTPNTPAAWADMYDSYQRAALATPLKIPMLYGIDAVHGNNNVAGATIFPHNVGLGATRDPALVQRVGQITAQEVTAAGQDWTFAPCVCVARDDRWGRTYESFGETPELVSSMTTIVTGLQDEGVLATAKHYLGDGGTTNGVDQGDTQLTEAQLRAIHLPPFRAAVERGAGSIMISFNSVGGQKMTANRHLIIDVLKGELGFTGFTVSDWAAVDQLDGRPGFTAAEVADAVNAGLDMLMVPEDVSRFVGYLRAGVQSGQIPMSRVDDANRRILTKKFELGLFEHPYADRSGIAQIGSAEHRAVARQAVRESQVLLKNDGILPLAPSAKIFVAGKSADDLGNQSGGWTMSWQGASGATISGTSILAGLRAAASSVTYSRDGSGIDGSYTAAIAVVGETPYAEGKGDRSTLPGLDADDRAVLSRLRAAGVPVITVLVSGRPLDVAADLPGWNALLAAWLPGSEGAGVADVLLGAYAPTGKLPVTWPQSAGQEPINDGDGKTPLFPYGHGLTFTTNDPDPTPSTSTTPSPSPSTSPSPVPAGCRVAYSTSDWSTGFTGTVGVTNTGATAIPSWKLTWTWPAAQTVTQSWSARVTQSGATVTAVGETWNAGLAPGATLSFGFNATHSGANPRPAAFALNGTPCTT